jgi:hypothetical protein
MDDVQIAIAIYVHHSDPQIENVGFVTSLEAPVAAIEQNGSGTEKKICSRDEVGQAIAVEVSNPIRGSICDLSRHFPESAISISKQNRNASSVEAVSVRDGKVQMAVAVEIRGESAAGATSYGRDD